jgi:hypothetical protein
MFFIRNDVNVIQPASISANSISECYIGHKKCKSKLVNYLYRLDALDNKNGSRI